MTVSIVTIFLDAERFLAEAVESVLAQTHGDWELLLVDDGSSDGGAGIAARYAAGDPERIRCLAHPGRENRGMSASRNLGLRHARGGYVAFLDADDVYRPEKLERQVAILETRPEVAMVYGATLHWHGWTGRPEDQGRDFPRKLGVPPDTRVPPPGLVARFLRHEGWPPGTCGALIRREAIDRIGGFEEEFRGMFEDQAFFYKLCLAETVFVESGSWDCYRQHPGSHCEVRRAPGDPRLDPARGVFLEWLARYFAKTGVIDAELWRLLRKELQPFRHPLRHRLSKALQKVAGR